MGKVETAAMTASAMSDLFCRTERHRQIVGRAAALARQFAKRAPIHDREGSVPFENLADLHASGHSLLTIPREYGGEGGGVLEMVLAQHQLAQGDGSTALAVGWHLFTLGRLAENRIWPEPIFAQVCRGAVTHGHLINAAVSEAATGSPSRGGRPTTTARRAGTGWVLNGHKTFTTLSPALHYFVVSAAIDGSEANGWFLVQRDTPGLEVVETWDTLGMRATGSHDLLLQEVSVGDSALVHQFGKDIPSEGSPGGGAGWNLHIPATYLGVAEAARRFALQFASHHRPNSVSTTIGELPNVQAHLGQIEIGLLAARTTLFTLAQRWDEEPDRRLELVSALGGVKVLVINTALDVVDRAMRVVGATSLYRSHPLERYYRDVRAGLHNPPMEDAVMVHLARAALSSLSEEAQDE